MVRHIRDGLPTTQPSGVSFVLRPIDATALAGEIRLRAKDLDADVRRLEEAQVVSQELLETIVGKAERADRLFTVQALNEVERLPDPDYGF